MSRIAEVKENMTGKGSSDLMMELMEVVLTQVVGIQE